MENVDTSQFDVDAGFFVDPSEFRVIPHVVNVLEESHHSISNPQKFGQGKSHVPPQLQIPGEDDPRTKLELDLQRVEARLEILLDKHYASFGNSVKSFSGIFQEFTEAQSRITYLKKHVMGCKQTLRQRKQQLKDLAQQKADSSEMISLIGCLEQVRDAPIRFRDLLERNEYVECVDEFDRVTTILDGDDFRPVSSLNESRNELESWKLDIAHAIQVQLKKLLFLDCLSFETVAQGPRVGVNSASFTSSKSAKNGLETQSSSLGEGSLQSLHLSKDTTNHLAMQNVLLAVQSLGRLPAIVTKIRQDLRMSVLTIFEENCKHAQSTWKANTESFHGDPSPLDMDAAQLIFHYQPVKTTFEKILRDCLFFMTNHQTLIGAVPLQEVGYTMNDPWNVLQVQLKQFIDAHLMTEYEAPLTSASPKSRAVGTEHFHKDSFMTNSVHPRHSQSAALGLNFLSVETNSKWEGPALSNLITHSSRSDTQPNASELRSGVREAVKNSDTLLCKPNPYLLLVFVPSLMDFFHKVQEILENETMSSRTPSSKRGPLWDYIQSTSSNMFKLHVEGHIRTFMAETLTAEHLRELVDHDPFDPMTSPDVESTLGANFESRFDPVAAARLDDEDQVSKTQQLLKPSIMTQRVYRIVNDLNTFDEILHPVSGGLYDLITQVLKETVKFADMQLDSGDALHPIGGLLKQDRDYMNFVKDQDSTLRYAIDSVSSQNENTLLETSSPPVTGSRNISTPFGGETEITERMIKLKQQSQSLSSTMEFIRRENAIFSEYSLLVHRKHSGGQSALPQPLTCLSNDGIVLLSTVSTSLMWLVRSLSASLPGIQNGSNVAQLLAQLENIHLKSLLTLHAEARLLAQLALDGQMLPFPGESEDSSLSSRARCGSQTGSPIDNDLFVRRMRSRLTKLGGQLTRMGRVMRPILPQCFLDYTFYSIGPSAASLLVQSMGKVHGTVELQVLKSLVQTGFILEHTLGAMLAASRTVSLLTQSFEAVAVYAGALTGNVAWDNAETSTQLEAIAQVLPGIDTLWLKSVLRNAKDTARKRANSWVAAHDG